MKKRIFIAINLPYNIKNALLANRKRWRHLDVRWTNPENMHITVEFLGNLDRQELSKVLKAVQGAVLKTEPFDLYLDKIVLGPNQIQANMFWATVSLNGSIMKLKNLVQNNLELCGFMGEKREFKPHITLARAKGNQLKGKQTNIPLGNMKIRVESVEVMESQLHLGGTRYKVVESFKLEEPNDKLYDKK